MASVWYIGSSGSKTITAEDWAGVGVTGATVKWNSLNGYSIPKTQFNPGQILVLMGESDFWLDAPDGSRIWSQVPGSYNVPGGNGSSSSGAGGSAIAQMLDILAQAQTAASSAASSIAATQAAASAAAGSAGTANTRANDATSAASAASGFATASDNARAASVSAKTASESARDTSVSAKTASEAAKTASESARDASVTARNASQSAQTASETAKTASQTAQGLSETAKTASESARTTTQGYRDTTLGYRNEAEAFKNQASQAATGAIPDGSLALVKFAASVQTSLGKADTAIQSAGLATTLASYQTRSEKGVANGYVPLDGSVKIASTYLPSYVDDVLEFANLAAFPASGETGKIYTALDTGRIYRWSGSMYVRIAASPGSTDEVPEGTNLYFTDARAQAALADSLGLKKDANSAVSGSLNGTAAALTVWYGTEAQYTALATKNASTLYFTS